MLAVVKRAYGGQEGARQRVGDLFWVTGPGTKGKPPEGVRGEITHHRFQQLRDQGLMGPADPNAKVEPPSRPSTEPGKQRRPAAPVPGAKVEPDSKGPRPRQSAKAKEPKPETVRARSTPKDDQDGGRRPRSGAAGPASSSPAARQTGDSTSPQRGQRRGQSSSGSPSTTRSDSSPGPASSTRPTPAGGASTPTPDDSAAFD